MLYYNPNLKNQRERPQKQLIWSGTTEGGDSACMIDLSVLNICPCWKDDFSCFNSLCGLKLNELMEQNEASTDGFKLFINQQMYILPFMPPFVWCFRNSPTFYTIGISCPPTSLRPASHWNLTLSLLLRQNWLVWDVRCHQEEEEEIRSDIIHKLFDWMLRAERFLHTCRLKHLITSPLKPHLV